MGVIVAMKRIITGLMAEKPSSHDKEDADTYEREMLLSNDSTDIMGAGIFSLRITQR